MGTRGVQRATESIGADMKHMRVEALNLRRVAVVEMVWVHKIIYRACLQVNRSC